MGDMKALNKFDPTGTFKERRGFLREIQRRFAQLMRDIREYFLVKHTNQFTTNAGIYEFLTRSSKVTAFRKWLTGKVDKGLLISDNPDRPWLAKFITSAYKLAVNRSFVDVTEAMTGKVVSADKKKFLDGAFSSKSTILQLEKMYTRAFENMKALTEKMKDKLSDILTTAVVDGKNPRAIVSELSREVGITKRRAETIARTELIHSYAEGQLDTFKELGVDELGVLSEWLTAGDGKVCPRCADRAGTTYSVSEARGLIPFHPNCRCAWIPYVPLPVKRNKDRPPKTAKAERSSAWGLWGKAKTVPLSTEAEGIGGKRIPTVDNPLPKTKSLSK